MGGVGNDLIRPAAQFGRQLRSALDSGNPVLTRPSLGRNRLIVDDALALDDHIQPVGQSGDEIRLVTPPSTVEVVRQRPAEAEVAGPGGYRGMLVEDPC